MEQEETENPQIVHYVLTKSGVPQWSMGNHYSLTFTATVSMAISNLKTLWPIFESV